MTNCKDGIQQVHAEAGGMLEIYVFRAGTNR